MPRTVNAMRMLLALKRWLCVMALMAVLTAASTPGAHAQAVNPDVQTRAQGTDSVTDIWGAIRMGAEGRITIPDANAARLIQSEGDNWRAIRNGPVTVYSAYALLGMIVVLSVFFVLRGRVRIEHGRAGVTLERFNPLERFGHWLMAGSFIVLALTGLNLLFGRYLLLPVIGKEVFAAITMWGKYAHNYVAFAFMAGVALVFVVWVVHNFPSRNDLTWLMQGGGILNPGSHPPARKFNAGQKIIFWLVVLGTISVSLSGIALMFPFQTAFMGKTFAALNVLGAQLSTDLSPLAEQQLNQIWHAIASVAFVCVILAHIYIGSVGMEGAFDAMGSGQVDLNWARQHHNLWVEEMEQRSAAEPTGEGGAKVQPAE